MGCECYGGNCTPRAFLTKEEKVARLKKYKDALENEARGVKERIAELESRE